MEVVNKQRQIFLSLSKLRCGPQALNSREIRPLLTEKFEKKGSFHCRSRRRYESSLMTALKESCYCDWLLNDVVLSGDEVNVAFVLLRLEVCKPLLCILVTRVTGSSRTACGRFATFQMLLPKKMDLTTYFRCWYSCCRPMIFKS